MRRGAPAYPVVPLCLAALLLCASSAAVAAAAAKSPARAAVDSAVDDLRKEFAAHLRDPAVRVREACDYFTEKPSPAVTVDAVFAALEAKLDPDPRTAAYVRWQLLSALPKEVEPAVLVRALHAYRNAPPPAARFGLAPAEQSKLDGMLQGVRPTNDVVLTSRLEARVREASRANRHFLAYRDEWYRRLPKGAPTFAAALQDAYERQTLAAGAEDFAPLVIADVQNWLVAGDADPPKCAALAELIAQLRSKEPPPFYASAAVRSGKLTWVKKTDSMDPRKKLTHLHQALVEAAQRRPAPKPK